MTPPAELQVDLETPAIALGEIGSAGNVRSADIADGDSFDELVASIRANGVLVPVLVVEAPADASFTWSLVDGHRRLAAARAAGVGAIPARILEPSDETDLRVTALVANLRRDDLTPVDEADAYAAILAAKGWTQKRLAEVLGVTQAHVSGRLRLTRIPMGARAAVVAGEVALQAVPTIERVADVAPALADELSRGDRQWRDFRAQTARDEEAVAARLSDLASARRRDADDPQTPFVYDLSTYSAFAGRQIEDFGLRADEYPELAAALAAAVAPLEPYDSVKLPVQSVLVTDAARSYGCLVELGGHMFVTDATWWADQVAQAFARWEPPKRTRAAGGTSDEDAAKAERAAKRDKDRLEQLAAGERNRALEQLLGAMLADTSALPGGVPNLFAAAAVEIVEPRVVAMVISDLHTVTVSGKPGKERAKTTLVPADEAERWVHDFVFGGDPDGLLHRAALVLLAHFLADNRVMPASGRPYSYDPGGVVRQVIGAAPAEVDPALIARFKERHGYALRDDVAPLRKEAT